MMHKDFPSFELGTYILFFNHGRLDGLQACAIGWKVGWNEKAVSARCRGDKCQE